MKPHQLERREWEYKRHGTQCLIANFEVATGEIIAPTIGKTRNEQDFAKHITQTIEQDPEAKWIFVVDNLNIHKSETLVRLIADYCHIDQPLGEKGKNGILRSMKTRAKFLSNPEHRIRFVYTHKHASWLNQIELWFSVLVRRLLKRLSVCSVEELRQKILDFIEYFNKTMAKPYKWTYKGQPLKI